jgi:filamentous hemagglutinin family protein
MKFRRFNNLHWRVFAGVWLLGLGWAAQANPTGMTVQSGSASAAANGPRLTITTSQLAVLNWQTFNIAAGETTIFNQPSISSVVVNRINDQNPSQIYGSLQANGMVVLLNSSGFYFGPNAFIQTAGLIVSTANCIPPQNSGGSWEFNGPPPLASIVNYGQIQVGNGGSAFLIADNVENHSSISAPGGSVGLASGQTVLLSERPDGRGMSMEVTLPQGSVNNYGTIVADGGTIAMNAKVVNQNGFLQANSVQNVGGVIELVASHQLNLGANSQILAKGDDSAGGSAGGSVTLQSGNSFSDDVGSQIDVSGGSQGGNGGNVEISAPSITAINTRINGQAQPGWAGGTLLVDPDYIVLNQSGSDSVIVNGTSGSLPVGYQSGNTLYLNVGTSGNNYLDSAFIGLSQITLEAKYDITLDDGTAWNLSASTGKSSGQLTLEAGDNITLNAGSSITDANNWSVALYAGVTGFSLPTATSPATPTVQSGSGSIWLNGGADQTLGSLIRTAAGNINLTAGQDILVNADQQGNSGYVITTGGGSIYAHAMAGNIDTGDFVQGYHFNSSATTLGAAYNLSGGLGGISTEAGGDVTLIAGGDVTSVLPVFNGYSFDGGSPLKAPGSNSRNGIDYLTAGAGAYGPEPGNVTIVAGGNVAGHYVVANGYGRIYAGVSMDNQGNPIIQKDSSGNPVNEVDGRGYPILLNASGAVIGRDAQGNPILLDGSGNVVDTTSAAVVPNGTGVDANGNPVNKYTIQFTLADGSTLNETAYGVDAYALNSASSGSAGTDLSYNGLALSVIEGGWNVNAVKNIRLQEVSNPNGVFDGSGTYSHWFDYASDSYVNLSANQVQLGATVTLPRLSSANNADNNVPVIYPPILNIMAGTGGVILGAASASSATSLILFPSPEGSLTINTTGSLVGGLNSSGGGSQLFNLIVSGANHRQYTATANFGASDLADPPIHQDNPTPLELNIAGDMKLVNLVVPEAAQINVGGNMLNCGFQGMNLAANDVTSINVAGDIFERGTFTSIDLSQFFIQNRDFQAPDLSVLSRAIITGDEPSAVTLAASFYYNPTTHVLTYENIPGYTLLDVLNLLNDLTLQKYLNGVPQWNDPTDNPPTDPTPDPNGPVSVLGNPTDPTSMAYALLQQYKYLDKTVGAIPNGATTYGYAIGGGGQFDITARSIDLGTSAGIISEGVALSANGSYPLAGLFGTGGVFSHGADINVTTTGNPAATGSAINGDRFGNLDMYASSIASWNGGSISINASGEVNAGSSVLNVTGFGATGIYSTGGGDVSVIAGSDINVNGSRITTYDGGNITVESLNGSVNAGTGASSLVGVTGYYEDPITQVVYSSSPQLPFSGIVAMTFPPRDASYPAPNAILGNILVEAPNGSINANVAGILQIPLNNLNYPDADVTVLAGYELRDSLGNPMTAGNLADGTPVLVSADRDINVKGSGIIASNAKLDASGNIYGLIFARNNIDINAQQNVNVTALGMGNVNVSSSGGTISGTLIGVGSVNVSGSSIDASLISGNVSGATSGQSGLGQGTAANATAQAASSDDANQALASSDQGGDDEKKKKRKEVALAQKVGRVTVILPAKSSPPQSSSQKQTATQPL